MTTDDPTEQEAPQREAAGNAEDDVEGNMRKVRAIDSDPDPQASSHAASKADESDDTAGHVRRLARDDEDDDDEGHRSV